MRVCWPRWASDPGVPPVYMQFGLHFESFAGMAAALASPVLDAADPAPCML